MSVIEEDDFVYILALDSDTDEGIDLLLSRCTPTDIAARVVSERWIGPKPPRNICTVLEYPVVIAQVFAFDVHGIDVKRFYSTLHSVVDNSAYHRSERILLEHWKPLVPPISAARRTHITLAEITPQNPTYLTEIFLDVGPNCSLDNFIGNEKLRPKRRQSPCEWNLYSNKRCRTKLHHFELVGPDIHELYSCMMEILDGCARTTHTFILIS
jgi:hypothetical protein